MKKAEHVLGLPVLAINTGDRLGEVRDLLFNYQWKLEGILLEEKAFLRKGRMVPVQQIVAIGEDCVSVASEDGIQPLSTDSSLIGMRHGEQLFKGKLVYTVNGKELGQIEDVYFQTELGTIIGYELSDGFISDMMEGRQVLRHIPQLIWGKDALIVPHDTETFPS